jgi:hypothetical protein
LALGSVKFVCRNAVDGESVELVNEKRGDLRDVAGTTSGVETKDARV